MNTPPQISFHNVPHSVVIETAIHEAPQYGWSAQEEMLLYVVHGMLHLVGEDDRTARQRAEMQRREREVLLALGIERR